MSDIAELQRTASALQPLNLPGSRSFAFFYAGGSSALIALAFVTLPFNPFLLPGAAVALIAVFIMAVMTVTPGATSLTIDEDGITRCLMFRTTRMKWQDAASIGSDWFLSATFPIAWNRQVFVRSRDDAGDELSFFPHQFGLNAEQAIGLLTPYLENARCKSEAPALQVPVYEIAACN